VEENPQMPEAGRRWRLVELARLGGISEQQVRNYIDAGMLPPVERGANNYRVLTDQHADALRTVRALADGHGWARTRAILGAVHAGDLPAALAAVDRGHAELTRERDSVASAVRAFTDAAEAPAPTVRRAAVIGQVAADIGVRAPVLRLWRPGRDPATRYRRFDPDEQRIAHLIAVLRRGGFDFAIIEGVVDALRAKGSTESALAELARRDRQVSDDSRRRLRASAAFAAYLEKYYS